MYGLGSDVKCIGPRARDCVKYEQVEVRCVKYKRVEVRCEMHRAIGIGSEICTDVKCIGLGI